MNIIYDQAQKCNPSKRFEVEMIESDYLIRIIDSAYNPPLVQELKLDRLQATLLFLRLERYLHNKPKEIKHESIT